MSSPSDWYNALPPISRTYGTLCMGTTVAVMLGMARTPPAPPCAFARPPLRPPGCARPAKQNRFLASEVASAAPRLAGGPARHLPGLVPRGPPLPGACAFRGALARSPFRQRPSRRCRAAAARGHPCRLARDRALAPPQVWRMLTNFLFLGKFGFGFVITLMYMCV